IVSPRIRSMVLFANHNLVRSPPFTRLDLVSCRNLLIYFEPPLQQSVLATLHYALKSGGKLLLGPSENLGAMAEFFTVLDAKYRLFESRGTTRLPLERSGSLMRTPLRALPSFSRALPSEEARAVQSASQLMLGEYGPSALLVDESMHLLHTFGRPLPFLHVASGAATLNVLRMVDGPVSALLSSAIPRAFSSGKESMYFGLQLEGVPSPLSIRIRVCSAADSNRRTALIVFESEHAVSPPDPVETVRVHPDTGRQLEELKRELDLSRETLQVTVEELQTSNEELQATNEELLSSNEELQSTNEELHSTNEELHTVNAEYARKNQELGELNSDIDNLLRSTNIGTVFLDSQLRVRKFTPAAADYIPLLERDVGRPLADLAFDCNGADLLGEARGVLEGKTASELPFDARERHALVRILPYIDHHGRTEGVVITFVDITNWKRAVLRTQRILDSIPEHVALLDCDGTILMVNRAWSRFATDNGGPTSYVGWNYLETCKGGSDEELAVRAAEGLHAVLSGQEAHFEMEYPCHAPHEQRWFLLHAAAVEGGEGAVVSHLNITQRKRAELALQEQAIHDSLTSLLNRRGIEQELARLSRAAARNDEWPGVIFVDCDNFKRINDTLGHATGDVVLQEVARRLSEALRPADRLARIGGDEFMVLLPGARLAEAGQVAERLRKAVGAQPVALSHGPLTLTISAAVLAADERLQSLSELASAARGALRSAKDRGKNRVFTRSRTGEERIAESGCSSLEALMEQDDAFGTLRHPLIRLDTEEVVGFEYLTRGPLGPFHLPMDLFHAASDLGVLTSVDLMCLRLSLKRCRASGGSLWHHVNLYPSTLLDTSLERLAALFPDDVPHRCYCLELSEQQILGDPSTMLEHVANLRRLGVRVAIDDVGFGRTSLETLVLIEPEVIKIDRRCVSGVASSVPKARSLERLLRVARSLDALVIAEGVETAADARTLSEMGVQYAQGFHFARPEPLQA
ncbi:MAG TPA: diguanylate cyclase, partial [Polyangiales bacterium]